MAADPVPADHVPDERELTARVPGRLDRRRWAPTLAVGTLLLVPVVAYALPAAFGHPVVPGDDLTQNLPLRELVGQDLRAGHLPVLDPYIWGGAPLLAGWNAGAAYPLTWLFAVLPAAAAWALNLAVAGAVAGAGCYAFLRANRLGVLASWLGGLTFAFGGGMTAQVPHLGLVVGMSWVPVALLGVLRLTAPAAGGLARWAGWTAVLAVAVGLVALSGEPRAVSDAVVAVGLYALWRLARLARAWWRRPLAGPVPGRPPRAGPVRDRPALLASLAGVAAGAVVGTGLGAIQLLPGLAAVATSQRAAVTASLFSSGSLPLRWLTLLAVPDVLGGSGSFGQPAFFATYNLTEITCYVGVLALVGAAALLGRLRRGGGVPEWVVWYGIGGTGVVLALGVHTPLWRVLIHVPLFGGQRLQSRSILVADLALAVLLAYWVDGWLERRRPPDRTGGREAVLGTMGALCVAGVAAAALGGGAAFARWMGVAAGAASREAALRPWLVPYLVLGVAAVALVWGGPRLPRGARAVGVSVLVVGDLAVFVLLAVLAVDVGGPAPAAPAPAPAAHPSALPAAAAAVRPIARLKLDGRFAVYDPTLLDITQLAVLGVPDANAVAGTYSAQGYGSIVDGRYAAATGVHKPTGTGQDVFSPAAARDGVLDALDTVAVLVPSPYLVTGPGGGPPATPGAGRRELTGATPARWNLGTPLDVVSLSLPVQATATQPGTAGAPALRLGVLTTTGRTVWAGPATPHPSGPGSGTSAAPATQWTARLARPVEAVGLVAESGGPMQAAAPSAVTEGGVRYVADGKMAAALAPPHWVYDGRDGAFAVLRDTRAAAPLRLRPVEGRSLAGASVHAVSGPSVAPTAAAVASPGGAEVVRAAAAVPGWVATWRPAGGAARPVAVHADGVVQSVRVPAGRGVLTWRYDAPDLAAGEDLSLVAAAVVVGLCAAAGLSRRRSRRSAR